MSDNKKSGKRVNSSGMSLDNPINGPKDPDNKWTFKVRCAITYAHYLFVQARTQDEAVMIAERHCKAGYAKDENFWEGEASHIHTQYEPEEA